MSSPTTPDGPRRRGAGLLDLPSIVDVALAIARTEGMAALSMRRIADELGRSPMALYRHVADRQALVLAMLDAVAARIVLPAPVDDPRDEITGLMHAVHHAVQGEPWIVTALVQEGLASPRILPVLDRLFAALDRAGLRGTAGLSASNLLWEFAYGELLTSHHDRPDSWNHAMARDSDPAAFPALHALMNAVAAETAETGGAGGGFPDQFDPHLQTVLDGLLGPRARPDPGGPP